MKKNLFPSNKILIQSASLKDYLALQKLALRYPLLNLPSEKPLLRKKIEQSVKSFAEALPKEKRNFLFVLKTEEGKLIGSSQVSSQSATKSSPSYSLEIFRENQESFLQLKVIKDGPSYLGGLILGEEYRGHPLKAGKQISLIRLLFAGMHSEVFKDSFHAEVAPFLDKKGKNPFFEKFIYPRVRLSMKEIDYLTLTDKQKLFSFYPREKILLSSLPEEVRESLGKPGFFSSRAYGLLKKQSFYFAEEVDPFDGGPYVQAKKKAIPVIKNTEKVCLNYADFKRVKGLNKKWLFGKIMNDQFLGGVLEGFLKGKNFFVEKESLDFFSLAEKEEIFISPF